jgi:gamma-glutamyl-gamma-aminobutyrate hydrolase PuuD
MMQKLLLFFILTFSLTGITCELPKNEVLTIGCSNDCSFIYRFRIMMTAMGMGYKVKFINMPSYKDLRKSLAEVDAVVLPGGADIDPKYYLDSITPELADYTKRNLSLVNFSKEGQRRDPFEYSLVKLYSQDDAFKNLPMLGICRGLQMMAVAQGIPLYLDIKTELGISNRMNRFDTISIVSDSDSLMDSIYKNDEIKGFKLHHQGIRLPYYEIHNSNYPLTKVTSYSNENKIAESIEYLHRPALGVQYHPERSFSAASVPVFRWVLQKACEYKTSHKKE